MRRYFDIALTILAATIFAPVALWIIAVVVLLAFLIGLLVLTLLFVLTYQIAGAPGVVIVVLGSIAATAYCIYKVGSERTKVRKVSQRLLSVRRALNSQGRDFRRPQNRPLSSITSCDEKAQKCSAYHVKNT